MRKVGGGATELRGTGSISHIIKNDWADKFREYFETQGIMEHLLKKYVDDILLITSNLGLCNR